MCVIAYIPKTAKEPKKSDLSAMWNKNPDGAGMMWIEKDGVHYSKGYFDFDEFYRDFLIIKRDYNFECAVHFRIATSGGINQAMCHPFPVTDKPQYLKKLWGKTNCAIMHNGILPIDTPHKDLNDTCEFIINNIYPYWKKDHKFFFNLPQNKKSIFEVNDLANNKLLMFSKDAVEMFGYWQKNDDYYVSNTYWKPVKNYGNYKSYYYWDEWKDDDTEYIDYDGVYKALYGKKMKRD